MSRDKNTKAFSQQKRHRRQWLTFVRMLRYGANNFTRNAWLTIAATAVMTITLLIIFSTVVARDVLMNSVDEISRKVDMSIYLRTETTSAQAAPIIASLKDLSNVQDASFTSSEQARERNANDNKTDQAVLNAINQATNKLPATIRVNLKNINDTSQLDNFVKTNAELKKVIDPERAPSFAGSRRTAIQNLARWTDFAQRAGFAASLLFVCISALIVFNTIRMAIFNRRDEIEMMKLIGADKSFIRGPFVVEAIVYGFIAALVATLIGLTVLILWSPNLQSYGIVMQPTVDFLTSYIGFVLLGMIFLGALVGTISSLLATRRYLKI